MWWLGVIVAVVLVLAIIGKVAEHNQRRTVAARRRVTVTVSTLNPRQEAERQSLMRRVDALSADLRRKRYRARCDHCGAPGKHGAEACRYCGTALTTSREVSGVSEGLS
jgi:hypothetical protein